MTTVTGFLVEDGGGRQDIVGKNTRDVSSGSKSETKVRDRCEEFSEGEKLVASWEKAERNTEPTMTAGQHCFNCWAGFLRTARLQGRGTLKIFLKQTRERRGSAAYNKVASEPESV
ncbi:hypothetical protein LXL04_008656 [Taraxacum kok-saghyz]